MFKIAHLHNVDREIAIINYVMHEESNFENDNHRLSNKYKTLTFNVSGDDYSLSFDLNCELEKLLNIPMNQTIDFNNYIASNTVCLNIKELNVLGVSINAKITRYLKNKFVVFLTFITDCNVDDNCYSGVVEIAFNLDDYLC